MKKSRRKKRIGRMDADQNGSTPLAKQINEAVCSGDEIDLARNRSVLIRSHPLNPFLEPSRSGAAVPECLRPFMSFMLFLFRLLESPLTNGVVMTGPSG
jgi:hypothetical protein